MVELSEQELQALYAWIDEVPLSRPKKNIARDFSDGGGYNDAIIIVYQANDVHLFQSWQQK